MQIIYTPSVTEPFTTDIGQFTHYTATTLTDFSFSGGEGVYSNVALTNKDTASTIGADIVGRKHFIQMKISSSVIVNGANSVIGCGLVQDGTHFLVTAYDRVTNNLYILVRNGAAGFRAGTSFSSTNVGVLTLPVFIGIAINGNEVAPLLNIYDSDATWETKGSARIDSILNFATVSLTGWKYGILSELPSTNGQTFNVDDLNAGVLDYIQRTSSTEEDFLTDVNTASGFLNVTPVPSKNAGSSSATETLSTAGGDVVITSGFNSGFD